MTERQEGFTLVEITIVVALIALLAAIAIPNLLRSKVSTNDALAQSTLKAIGVALENYMTAYGVYPTDANSLVSDAPSFLTTDYFSGTHAGFTFTPILSDYSYSVTASPASASQGSTSFTITTGGVIE